MFLSVTVGHQRTLRDRVSALSTWIAPNRMFWLSVAILSVGCLIGAIAAVNRPHPPSEPWYHQVTTKLAHWPSWSAFAIHNIGIAILAASGRFTGGVLAGLLITLTGYTLGGALMDAYVRGYPSVVVATLVLPHGVVELWGLLLAASFGLEGGDIRGSSTAGTIELRKLASSGLLLLFAACLESTVTPYCVRLVMS